MVENRVKKLDRSRFKNVGKPTQTEQRALDYFKEVNDRYSAQEKVQSK
jgi:putative IMPACT (imprinted ancient) family translation regulator